MKKPDAGEKFRRAVVIDTMILTVLYLLVVGLIWISNL